MKNRLITSLVLACAVTLTFGTLPATAQEAGQTVKASIPPQAQPPVAAPVPQRPVVAQPPMAPPIAKPFADYESANVKVEVTITYQVGNAAPVRRTATLTVADQGRGSLRSGNQVAVPSTSYQPLVAAKSEGGTPAPAAPLTSFNYKSVGLNVDTNRVSILGNKARMDLNVEFSAIDEKTADSAGKPPSFPTFSQNLSLILESGKPLVVGQSSDFVDGVQRTQTVEVKATILR